MANKTENVASKSKRKLKRRDNLFVLTLVLWAVIHFLVFWVYVNATSLVRLFQTYNAFKDKYVFSGLYNLKHVFNEMVLGNSESMHRAMLNSLFSVIPGLFIILPLAFITSYAFYKHVPGEKLFRVLFYLPSMISIVVLTMSYKYMFDPQFGPIRLLFNKMGFTELKWLSAVPDNNMLWPLIYLYCVWSGLGSNVILIGGAMQRIPKEIIESARLDGVGFWRESVSIVLPLVMPTVTNFIVLALMGVFGFMMQPMLLTDAGGGSSGAALTVAMYIYNTAASGVQAKYDAAITTGILFSLMFGPIVFIVKVILDKLTPKVEF